MADERTRRDDEPPRWARRQRRIHSWRRSACRDPGLLGLRGSRRRRSVAGQHVRVTIHGNHGTADAVAHFERRITCLTEEEFASTDHSVLIAFGGTAIRGSLQDNAATASLLAQLPLQLSFSDFGGQEKIAPLPAPLSLDGMPPGSDAEPGTIGYYAPSQSLVLYYDNVGYDNGIVPIGSFDDVATIRDAPAFTGTLTGE